MQGYARVCWFAVYFLQEQFVITMWDKKYWIISRGPEKQTRKVCFFRRNLLEFNLEMNGITNGPEALGYFGVSAVSSADVTIE